MGNHIISLVHTSRHDNYITLWRPENAGYCVVLGAAGKYDKPKKGYHDSESNTPIKIEEAEKIAITLPGGQRVIPNTKAIWDILGMKMTKSGLQLKARKEVTNG